MSHLAIAQAKLQNPTAPNVPSFPFEDLPNGVNDPIWDEIELAYQLTVVDVAALKRQPRNRTASTASLESAMQKLKSMDFPFDLLPEVPIDNHWSKIRSQCKLTLSEVSALKNAQLSTSKPASIDGRVLAAVPAPLETECKELPCPAPLSLVRRSMPDIPELSGVVIYKDQLLGEGQHARVVAATWTRLKSGGGEDCRAVAVKIPKTSVNSQQSFMQDLNMMKLHPHQNILIVYGVVSGCLLNIVCEKLNMNLLFAISDGRIKNRQIVVRVARDIAAGLEHLHSHNVRHGDVKAKNVLLRIEKDRILQVKLCDFGSCTNNGFGNLGTSPEGVVGTPGLDPPPRTCDFDVWNFGFLLLNLINAVEHPSMADESKTHHLEDLKKLAERCQVADSKLQLDMHEVCEQLDALMINDGLELDELTAALESIGREDKIIYDDVWNNVYVWSDEHKVEAKETLEQVANLATKFSHRPKPRQSASSFQALSAVADSSSSYIAICLKECIEKYGKFQKGKRKEEARAKVKVRNDYNGDWSYLLDFERYSGIFSRFRNLQACLQDLQNLELSHHIKICRMKDRLNEPSKLGYRDILLNFEDQKGFVFEVQLHLERMHTIKSQSHRIYELQRIVDQKRSLIPAEPQSAMISFKEARNKPRAVTIHFNRCIKPQIEVLSAVEQKVALLKRNEISPGEALLDLRRRWGVDHLQLAYLWIAQDVSLHTCLLELDKKWLFHSPLACKRMLRDTIDGTNDPSNVGGRALGGATLGLVGYGLQAGVPVGMTAVQSISSLLNSNIFSALITFALLSAADFSRYASGDISAFQLRCNMVEHAGGSICGAAGATGGAALGLLTGPAAPVFVPIFSFVGSFLGGFISRWSYRWAGKALQRDASIPTKRDYQKEIIRSAEVLGITLKASFTEAHSKFRTDLLEYYLGKSKGQNLKRDLWAGELLVSWQILRAHLRKPEYTAQEYADDDQGSKGEVSIEVAYIFKRETDRHEWKLAATCLEEMQEIEEPLRKVVIHEIYL